MCLFLLRARNSFARDARLSCGKPCWRRSCVSSPRFQRLESIASSSLTLQFPLSCVTARAFAVVLPLFRFDFRFRDLFVATPPSSISSAAVASSPLRRPLSTVPGGFEHPAALPGKDLEDCFYFQKKENEKSSGRLKPWEILERSCSDCPLANGESFTMICKLRFWVWNLWAQFSAANAFVAIATWGMSPQSGWKHSTSSSLCIC